MIGPKYLVHLNMYKAAHQRVSFLDRRFEGITEESRYYLGDDL